MENHLIIKEPKLMRWSYLHPNGYNGAGQSIAIIKIIISQNEKI